MSRLREAVRQLAVEYSRGGGLALLTDYDGTLTPIVAHPSLARLDQATRETLQRLARLPRVRLAIVSSRALEDLKELTRLSGVCLSGTSGLETELDGRRILHPRARRKGELVGAIEEVLRDVVADYPGAWVENKRFSLTLHYRDVAAERAEPLLDQAAHVLECWADDLRTTPGPKALEIMPDRQWTKGPAVSHLLDQLGIRGTGVLYAGDAPNDAEAIDVVNQMDGVTIGVGPMAPSGAAHHVEDSAALVALLEQLYGALAADRSTQEPSD